MDEFKVITKDQQESCSVCNSEINSKTVYFIHVNDKGGEWRNCRPCFEKACARWDALMQPEKHARIIPVKVCKHCGLIA